VKGTSLQLWLTSLWQP